MQKLINQVSFKVNIPIISTICIATATLMGAWYSLTAKIDHLSFLVAEYAPITRSVMNHEVRLSIIETKLHLDTNTQ